MPQGFPGNPDQPARIWITSAADLKRIGRDDAFPGTGNYILAADLALDADWQTLPALAGVRLDGNGHRVGPLTRPLFSALEDAVVRGLVLDASIMTRTEPSPNGCGAVAALAQTAQRCLVEDCTVYGTVDGLFTVGGLLGAATSCDVNGCVNHAALFVESAGAGGVCAFATNSNFFHCRNHGAVRCMDGLSRTGLGDLGGIVGTLWASWERPDQACALVDCFNDGEISAYHAGGGIVGLLRGDGRVQLEVLRCVNRGRVGESAGEKRRGLGGLLFGGVVGQGVSFFRIQDCMNSGEVSGCGSVGGIVGEARHPKWGWNAEGGTPPPALSNRLERCENHGEVRLLPPSPQAKLNAALPAVVEADGEGLRKNAGGIAGAILYIGGASHCKNFGAVSSSADCTGGIAGLCRTASLEYCENFAPVSGDGKHAGGVVGLMDRVLSQDLYPMPPQLNQSICERCVNRGPVHAKDDAAGGIAGALLSGAHALDCRSCAEVAGTGAYIGGVAGFADMRDTIAVSRIERCTVSAPAVRGAAHVHRVLGGRGSAACVSLEGNSAAPGIRVTGDNTTDSGVKYQGEPVDPRDPQAASDGFHGESWQLSLPPSTLAMEAHPGLRNSL